MQINDGETHVDPMTYSASDVVTLDFVPSSSAVE